MQRCSGRGARHDVADDGAYLVLGIGRARDRRPCDQRGARRALGPFEVAEPAELTCQLLDGSVGSRVTGQPQEHAHTPGTGQRAHELGLRRRQTRRKEHHDSAELPQRRRRPGKGRGGRGCEVFVVVERGGPRPELAVQARDRRRRLSAAVQPVEGAVARPAEVEERRVKRPLGGRVAGDRPERVVGVGDHGSDGLGPQRPRERPAALLGQRRRAEELRQARQHQEPHVDQAVGPGERPPEGEAGVRRGHRHGDGSQRVGALRLSDRLPERGSCGRPVRDELDPGHRLGRYRRDTTAIGTDPTPAQRRRGGSPVPEFRPDVPSWLVPCRNPSVSSRGSRPSSSSVV